MEPEDHVMKDNVLKEAVLRHLPIEIRGGVVRKYPEFQEMNNMASYNLENLEIDFNKSEPKLIMKESPSKKKWMWKFQTNMVLRQQRTYGADHWVNIDRFELIGTVEKNFQKLIDSILPKIGSTLTKLKVQEEIPALKFVEKIKTKSLILSPSYPMVSLDRYMDMVDTASLKTVTIDEFHGCVIGNFLNHPSLEKCDLDLHLNKFNVNTLKNVASKRTCVLISTIRGRHSSGLNTERVLQLAFNFVTTRNAGFKFVIIGLQYPNWSDVIEDIVKKPGWSRKYICITPCATFEQGNVEINIYFPINSTFMRMEIMNQGTAKAESTCGCADVCLIYKNCPAHRVNGSSLTSLVPAKCSKLAASQVSSNPCSSVSSVPSKVSIAAASKDHSMRDHHKVETQVRSRDQHNPPTKRQRLQ